MKRGDQHIVAIDLETGGLEPGKNSILAIGAYWQDFRGREHRFRVLTEREPDTVVHPAAAAKNGWESDEQWLGLGALSLVDGLYCLAEWLTKLADALGGETLEPLGHHSHGVDQPFLEYWADRFGALPELLFESQGGLLRNTWHDSKAALLVAQTAGLVPCKHGASLEAMGKYMGRSRRSALHDAAEDAQLCHDGYYWLADLMRRGRAA